MNQISFLQRIDTKQIVRYKIKKTETKSSVKPRQLTLPLNFKPIFLSKESKNIFLKKLIINININFPHLIAPVLICHIIIHIHL